MAANWDTGQLALFEAIGSIVERVGSDGAQGRQLSYTPGLNQSNGC